ncbi:hypothetical protein PGTUg99_009134 [Puccinia graminis f. sp. tritici]|uniref:Uncharacterized protein n=1 Tax=Puccinia graminis f. sp. tritici TaxID=56615 RepID=A0A5B0NIW3_PUCGR|nr:hypothetical protein PGTUg99_009134 [Puccinia graminis f. sp. tritici]
MTTSPDRNSLNTSSSTVRRVGSSPHEHRTPGFGFELRILRHSTDPSSPNPDHSVAEQELAKCSVALIDSYLSQSNDLRLVLNLIEAPHQPASSSNSDLAPLEGVQLTAPIDSLGEDALEYCIPPPYRSPSLSASEALLIGHRTEGSTGSKKASIHSHRTRLRSLKPWHSFTSLAQPDPTYDLKLLSASSSPDSQRRGFWLIPVWKSCVTRYDYYGRFGDLISLPTWSDPKLSPPLINPSSSTLHAQEHRISSPIVWNPIRLSLFWKVICIICEKRKLGDVSATAMATSHTKDILPYSKPIPSDANPALPEPGDVFGDHIRIWSNLQTSLIIRRVISDITIRSAIRAQGTNLESPVPFLNLNLLQDDSEDRAGDCEEKWLKNCVFMWLDDTGTPRGYG